MLVIYKKYIYNKIPWWCISCVGQAESGEQTFEELPTDWDSWDDFQPYGSFKRL